MTTIYRVQDDEGRGPFKPGFTKNWADPFWAAGTVPLPTWMAEFGEDRIRAMFVAGEHAGCGVRDLQGIRLWFSATERFRLSLRGYSIVRMEVDRILAESRNQVVFSRILPLNEQIEVLGWLL